VKTIKQGDIISYLEMCSIEGTNLQRGMNFRMNHRYSVILMSRRSNAPYSDKILEDSITIEYEGHDAPKTSYEINPKTLDQPKLTRNGTLTQNGKFIESVEKYKKDKYININKSVNEVNETIKSEVNQVNQVNENQSTPNSLQSLNINTNEIIALSDKVDLLSIIKANIKLLKMMQSAFPHLIQNDIHTAIRENLKSLDKKESEEVIKSRILHEYLTDISYKRHLENIKTVNSMMKELLEEDGDKYTITNNTLNIIDKKLFDMNEQERKEYQQLLISKVDDESKN